MTRSLKKGIFSEVSLTQDTGIQSIWSRRSMILPDHVHKEVQVHNGKTFHKIKIEFFYDYINNRYKQWIQSILNLNLIYY